MKERPFEEEDAAKANLALLIQLRWLAVIGQLTAIVVVAGMLEVALPVGAMLAVVGVLAAVNQAADWYRSHARVRRSALLATLMVDVACLSAQLWFSGGAANPFISLFLLQVVLGAVLLDIRSTWILVGVTVLAFAALAAWAPPLSLPPAIASGLSPAYLLASWFNYVLAAGLLVLFVTQITRNLRQRDARIAALRQRAAEEEQIVRMGLLASGAAHELGTPLASLSVALGDWGDHPPDRHELGEMQAEVARCKAIVAGILFAAGEVTGEAPSRVSLARFIRSIVVTADRHERVDIDNRLHRDATIVADRAFAQALTSLIENAVEAGARTIGLTIFRDGDDLTIRLEDDGNGFAPDMLANLGKPYASTKDRRGAGLGLFLATNVLRTLGGTLTASNRAEGGARVVLRLPGEALAMEEPACAISVF